MQNYDPSYFRISYLNGDIPADKGVCSDVVIRAYRKTRSFRLQNHADAFFPVHFYTERICKTNMT
ncbi:MAG: DUF1287 domain-containing protein [Candidatus Azobacteroides sp.]|nr:DUF1287 domain-containing protein [Candidatus Azobacteroides sp.]